MSDDRIELPPARIRADEPGEQIEVLTAKARHQAKRYWSVASPFVSPVANRIWLWFVLPVGVGVIVVSIMSLFT